MFEIGDGDIQEILQLPCNSQILDNLLRLAAKVTVDLQSFLGVDV